MNEVYILHIPDLGMQGIISAYSLVEDAQKFAEVNELEDYMITPTTDLTGWSGDIRKGRLCEVKCLKKGNDMHFDGLHKFTSTGRSCTIRLDPWLNETRLKQRLYIRSRSPGLGGRILECRAAYSRQGKHPLLLMPTPKGSRVGMAADGTHEVVFAGNLVEASAVKVLVRI